MIDHDAKVIGHVSPLRPIDINHIGRKAFISELARQKNGDREPDPRVYRYDTIRDGWILKDGV